MQVNHKYQGFTKIGLVASGLLLGFMLSLTYSAVAEKMAKPQLPLEDLRAFAEVFGKIKTAVSYTHLDVYKRQILR